MKFNMVQFVSHDYKIRDCCLRRRHLRSGWRNYELNKTDSCSLGTKRDQIHFCQTRILINNFSDVLFK